LERNEVNEVSAWNREERSTALSGLSDGDGAGEEGKWDERTVETEELVAEIGVADRAASGTCAGIVGARSGVVCVVFVVLSSGTAGAATAGASSAGIAAEFAAEIAGVAIADLASTAGSVLGAVSTVCAACAVGLGSDDWSAVGVGLEIEAAGTEGDGGGPAGPGGGDVGESTLRGAKETLCAGGAAEVGENGR
jgi:hypothetical protein